MFLFAYNVALSSVGLLLVDVIIHQNFAEAARVTVAPVTVVALENANANVQYGCEVEGVGLDWFLNGTHDASSESAFSKTDITGVTASSVIVFSSNLSVSTAGEFDNLQIVCRARGKSQDESEDSNPAWLRLEAPLETPYRLEAGHNMTQHTISLSWVGGVVEHVELFYNITITKMGSDDNTEWVVQTQETEFSFGLDHPFAESCKNYSFSVVAWNQLDISDASETVSAAFHCPTAISPKSIGTPLASPSSTPTASTTTEVEVNKRNSGSNAIYISIGVLVVVATLFAVAVIIIMIILCCKKNKELKCDKHPEPVNADFEKQLSTDNNSSDGSTNSQDPLTEKQSPATTQQIE